MKRRVPFTEAGLNKIKLEKTDLETQRIAAVANLKIAREMGDLSENAAYKVARMKLSSVDRRLRVLNRVLDGAYIIEVKSTDVVEVGSVVTLQGKNGESKFTIVSSHESDVSVGKISYYSPIGTALMGKRLNSTVIVKTPSGQVNYLITKIAAE